MIEKPFENWLEIPGYEELYEIDHFGNIRALDRKVRNKNGYRIIKGKMLKSKLDNHGYLKIGLVKDNQQRFYLIHRKISFSGFEQIWYGYKWKHLVEKVEEE